MYIITAFKLWITAFIRGLFRYYQPLYRFFGATYASPGSPVRQGFHIMIVSPVTREQSIMLNEGSAIRSSYLHCLDIYCLNRCTVLVSEK